MLNKLGKNVMKNYKCSKCEQVIEKEVIALNKKLLGRNIIEFFCLTCLADHLELPEELLKGKIDDLKKQVCT